MGATDGFSKLSRNVYMHIFLGGFKKAICSSRAALEQLLALQQEGLGKSVKF